MPHRPKVTLGGSGSFSGHAFRTWPAAQARCTPLHPMAPHCTPWHPMAPHCTPLHPIAPQPHCTPLHPIAPCALTAFLPLRVCRPDLLLLPSLTDPPAGLLVGRLVLRPHPPAYLLLAGSVTYLTCWLAGSVTYLTCWLAGRVTDLTSCWLVVLLPLPAAGR